MLARFIGGLSKANVSLSMAIVTDASDEKTRPRGMVSKIYFVNLKNLQNDNYEIL